MHVISIEAADAMPLGMCDSRVGKRLTLLSAGDRFVRRFGKQHGQRRGREKEHAGVEDRQPMVAHPGEHSEEHGGAGGGDASDVVTESRAGSPEQRGKRRSSSPSNVQPSQAAMPDRHCWARDVAEPFGFRAVAGGLPSAPFRIFEGVVSGRDFGEKFLDSNATGLPSDSYASFYKGRPKTTSFPHSVATACRRHGMGEEGRQWADRM